MQTRFVWSYDADEIMYSYDAHAALVTSKQTIDYVYSKQFIFCQFYILGLG